MVRRTGTGTTLYLRGMPESLVREVKAHAARRGVTLTRFVSDALAEKVGRASGTTHSVEEPSHPPSGELASLEASAAWYAAHQDEVLARHRDEYVAIIDQQVVDHDTDFGSLARRVFERYGARPVFMPKVVPGERTVRLPSPRIRET